MKLKRVSFYFIDLDEVDNEEVVSLVENVCYPNRCITPLQTTVEEADIGEWSDDHRCNYLNYELAREFPTYGFQEYFGTCKNCKKKTMLNNSPKHG